MNQPLDYIIARLDDIHEEMVSVKVAQAKHNVSLEEHMRRSDALEKHLQVVQSEVVPLKAHVAMWAGASKLVAVLASIVGGAAAFWKLTGH